VSIGYEEVLLSQEELEWTAGEDEKLIAAVVKTVYGGIWWLNLNQSRRQSQWRPV
jgi:hypothetical protein